MPRKATTTGGRKAAPKTSKKPAAKQSTAKKAYSKGKAVRKASGNKSSKGTISSDVKKAVAKKTTSNTEKARTARALKATSIKSRAKATPLSASEKQRLDEGNVARATNYVSKQVTGTAKRAMPTKQNAVRGTVNKTTTAVTNTAKKSNAARKAVDMNRQVARKQEKAPTRTQGASFNRQLEETKRKKVTTTLK